jgi:hypothetical protein
MNDRRVDPRLLCADLVEIEYKDRTGRRRTEAVNLEDISSSGACLQMEIPIAAGTAVKIKHGKGLLAGRIRYCVFREIGYFVGVEFEGGEKWSQKQFRPMHLLDPRRLGTRTSAKG